MAEAEALRISAEQVAREREEAHVARQAELQRLEAAAQQAAEEKLAADRRVEDMQCAMAALRADLTAQLTQVQSACTAEVRVARQQVLQGQR